MRHVAARVGIVASTLMLLATNPWWSAAAPAGGAGQPAERGEGTGTRVAQTVVRVSVTSEDRQVRRWSGWNGNLLDSATVSESGRFVAFKSAAGRLVPGDTNRCSDIFVRDTLQGTTTRVSIATNGHQGNRRSFSPRISAKGRYIAFSSRSTNLAPEDDNERVDAFVHDRVTGTTTLVSIRPDAQPITRPPRSYAFATSISDNGQRIVFTSNAPGGRTDLSPVEDVFVRFTGAEKTVLVSQWFGKGDGLEAWDGAISGNGRYVVFDSVDRNLLPPHRRILGDLYVRDLRTGKIKTASAGWGKTRENGFSSGGELSRGGKYVAFISTSRNLTETPSPRGLMVDVRNLTTDKTWLVGPGGDRATISADGSVVAFLTDVRLVASDTGDAYDVYTWSRITGVYTRVNVRPDGSQSVGDKFGGFRPAVSADAATVAFTSGAPDLVPADTNGKIDVFLAQIPGVPPAD